MYHALETTLERRNTVSLEERHRAVRALAGSAVSRVCGERFGRPVQAVVLTGSLARYEATILAEGAGWRLVGDADLIVILRADTPLPAAAESRELEQGIERTLAGMGAVCPVSISFTHAGYLRGLRPAIFAYELLCRGDVVWGDRDVLRLIPAFAASGIPREDAWRLLANRIVEQLECAAGVPVSPEPLPPEAQRATSKLYLDMATSLLVFAGRYEPTYAARLKNLRALAGERRDGGWPLDLAAFAERVAACQEWRFRTEESNAIDRRLWDDAVNDAARLWQWESERLAYTSPLRRLRGWLYVVRRQGWQQSRRQWPRWARLAMAGSPRDLVYRAATDLFFDLPRLAAGENGGDETGMMYGNMERRVRSLPVRRHPAAAAMTWRDAAAEIAWNYHEFVEGTRA